MASHNNIIIIFGNMNPYKYRLLCLLLLGFALPLLATEHLPIVNYHVSNWEVENDFGKTVIGDVVFDINGELILATSAGIKKFDGLNFSDAYPYQSQLNTSSISRLQVTFDNQVWGVNRFGLVNFKQENALEIYKPITFNLYSSFIVTQKAQLWFITNQQVYKVINNKPIQIKIPLKATAMSYSPHSNLVMVGALGSVAVLDEAGKITEQYYFEDKNTVVYSIFSLTDGSLLIDTNHGVFEQKNNKLRPYKLLEKLPGIRKFFEDSRHNLWIATNYGIYLIQAGVLKEVNFKDNHEIRIRGLAEDEFGNIWFGTWSRGLFRLKPTEFDVINTQVNPNAFLSASDGKQWIGGFEGLTYFQSGTETKIELNNIESPAVNDLAEGLNGNIWVAFRTNLVKFDGQGKNPQIIDEIGAFGYYFLLKDDKNRLWVGTNKGLFVKNLITDANFLPFKLPNNERSRTMVELGNHQLLLISDKNNYIFEDDKLTQNAATKLLDKNNLLVSYDKSTKTLWSINQKENVINKIQNNKKTSYQLDEMLKNLTFYTIEVDAYKNIIVLTENGIMRIKSHWFEQYNEALKLFYEMIPMPSVDYSECNSGHSSITFDKNHNLNLTCKDMVLILDPKKSQRATETTIKQLKLNRISIAEKKYTLMDAPKRWSPDTRSYEFSFTSLATNQLLPIKYRYQMLGSDKDWHPYDRKNSITYIDLKPGNYTFKVQARTSNSDWQSSENSQYSFTVMPYFYQRAWFISLVSVVLILLYILNNFMREMMHKRENIKLSRLIKEKTKELKAVQKRELESEEKSRKFLLKEVEKRTKDLKNQMSLNIEKEQQLREAQKMEVVGQMTSGIAHDFNNMLSVIFIGSDLIRKNLSQQGNGQEENIKWLDKVLLTAKNCREVIGQLLKFSRSNKDDLQILNVHATLAEIVSLIKVGIPETIEFAMELCQKEGLVAVDLSQLNQIILNLIINSTRACEDYGKISIKTSHVSCAAEHICSSCHQSIKGQFVKIEIADTGKGIPAEILPNIFTPFFSQGKDSSGIGLHIVHTNIHNLGGHLQVQSVPDKGTRFFLYLPLVQSQEAAANIISSKPKEVSFRNNVSVLVVEDSESLLELICMILEDSEIAVDFARNGQEGLALFRQNPDKYDMILTDNSMPKLSGLGMAEKILTQKPQMKVVLLTGDVNGKVMAKSDELGIAEIVLKPINADELVGIVMQHVSSSEEE